MAGMFYTIQYSLEGKEKGASIYDILGFGVILIPLGWISATCGENKYFYLVSLLEVGLKKYKSH